MRQANALDFLFEVRRNQVPRHSMVAKFGTNTSVDTTLVPISRGGIYQTPSSLTSLEILSDDANDTAAGSGAQAYTIQGLSTNWLEVSETVEMAGATPVALANQYYRVYRMFASRSGTYATQSASSQKGTVTLRVADAGATWASVGEIVAGFGGGQSQIGCYSIEAGKTGIVIPRYISIDGTKTVTVVMFRRDNIDDTSTPYSGVLRLVTELDGLSGVTTFPDHTMFGPFVGPCDIGFMGVVAQTAASVSVDFMVVNYESSYGSRLI